LIIKFLKSVSKTVQGFGSTSVFCAHGADTFRKQQEQQRQQAMNDLRFAQNYRQPVSPASQFHLDPYHMRQAQAHNQQLAAQQAAFTAKATGIRKI
jgi:hypothetical protein